MEILSEAIKVRVTAAQRARLEEIAEHNRRTLSDTVRLLLEEHTLVFLSGAEAVARCVDDAAPEARVLAA